MILEYIMEHIRISLRTIHTICGWWIREKRTEGPSVDTQRKERVEKKDETKEKRKPVGRQWSVGTISADACSYAVRVLLSRAEIPAGFLRSLSSRAVFAERWNGGEQGCRKKERDEKKEGEQGGDWKKRRGRPRRLKPVLGAGHGPPTTFTRLQELWSRPAGEPVDYISRGYVDGGAHRVMGKYCIAPRQNASRRGRPQDRDTAYRFHHGEPRSRNGTRVGSVFRELTNQSIALSNISRDRKIKLLTIFV